MYLCCWYYSSNRPERQAPHLGLTTSILSLFSEMHYEFTVPANLLNHNRSNTNTAGHTKTYHISTYHTCIDLHHKRTNYNRNVYHYMWIICVFVRSIHFREGELIPILTPPIYKPIDWNMNLTPRVKRTHIQHLCVNSSLRQICIICLACRKETTIGTRRCPPSERIPEGSRPPRLSRHRPARGKVECGAWIIELQHNCNSNKLIQIASCFDRFLDIFNLPWLCVPRRSSTKLVWSRFVVIFIQCRSHASKWTKPWWILTAKPWKYTSIDRYWTDRCANSSVRFIGLFVASFQKWWFEHGLFTSWNCVCVNFLSEMMIPYPTDLIHH